ncbi:uncharacterized protein LOC128273889 [Anopheles cruzii]|uniref:uncharacterized protein LOC128273889 n=1 Tax=Anopheles cruzii TaxID=68878 RepID=UPI0022EC3605|nr:uncharacterized protein LOC128273889 [Anopheles cruzii]
MPSPVERPFNSKFCKFYKPLLVEEVALIDHPVKLHHGKCAVIGQLAEDGAKLMSLAIPELPEEIQLPDCSFAVDISVANFRDVMPNKGNHVQVYGELLLHNTCTLLATTPEILRSTIMELNGTELCEAVLKITASHRPFIEVDHIEHTARARELVACNLRMRNIGLERLRRRFKKLKLLKTIKSRRNLDEDPVRQGVLSAKLSDHCLRLRIGGIDNLVHYDSVRSYR